MNYSTIKACGLLALLLLVSSTIKAQTHPCGAGPGPGEVQVGESPGGNGLAPTPMCNWTNGNQSQGPQRPPERWQDHWGAIATDAIKGVIGTVTNMPNGNEAEAAALADCQSKGGSACKIQLSYRNQCAAMVAGDAGYNTNPGATVEIAAQKGMKICGAATKNCHIYYSACSMPVRIQ